MKVAINTTSLRQSQLSDALYNIASLNCKYIELSTDGRAHAYEYITSTKAFNVNLSGLQIIAISGGWCDFADNSCDTLSKQVHLCRLLRTNKLRIFATNPHKRYNYEKIYGSVVSNIRNHAMLYPDIFFLIENHGGLTSTGEMSLKLLEDINLSNVGTVYDPANYLICGENPISALRCLRHFIKHVHAKNYLNGKFSSVDKGELDWGIIINELREIDYKGFLSIEYEGKGDPISGLKSSFKYLLKLL